MQKGNWQNVLRKFENQKMIQRIEKQDVVHKIIGPAVSFTNDRFGRIKRNDVAYPIENKDSILIYHLIPLLDFRSRNRFDVNEIGLDRHAVIGGRISNFRLNSDGYLAQGMDRDCECVTQFFRHGVVETVYCNFVKDLSKVMDIQVSPKLIPVSIFPKLNTTINSQMSAICKLGVEPPILLQFSFFGLYDVSIQNTSDHSYGGQVPFKKNELRLQPTIILEFNENHNYFSQFNEQMNFLWNAFALKEFSISPKEFENWENFKD